MIREGNTGMFLQHKKLVLGGVILGLFLLLVACSPSGSDSGNGNTKTGSITAVTTITPQLVTPKAAHTTRGGMIVFQLPTAATSSLRLLYRPEIASETAITLLIVS